MKQLVQKFNKTIIYYKLTLAETILQKSVIKRIKAELFDLKWTINFYKIKWISKITKNKTTLVLAENQKKESNYNYILKYGDYNVQTVVGDFEFFGYLIQPLMNEESLWEGPTDISKSGRLQYVANAFFNDYNEFLVDTQEEGSSLIGRNPMFPLNVIKDSLFYNNILFLEEKYSSKITTFIAINYINRMLNGDYPGIEDIEERTCDLKNIFRHKSSLGWFIALLKIIEPKVKKTKYKKELNLSSIIQVLLRIYENLDDIKVKK